MHSLDEIVLIMGMKERELTNIEPYEDGTLVTTHDGTKTIINPDGTMVFLGHGAPAPVLNLAGRGSVQRTIDAVVAAAELAPPKPVVAGPAPVEPATQSNGDDGVPTGTAAEVLGWVNGERDRAVQALAAEKLRATPRAGLTAQLEKLAS